MLGTVGHRDPFVVQDGSELLGLSFAEDGVAPGHLDVTEGGPDAVREIGVIQWLERVGGSSPGTLSGFDHILEDLIVIVGLEDILRDLIQSLVGADHTMLEQVDNLGYSCELRWRPGFFEL